MNKLTVLLITVFALVLFLTNTSNTKAEGSLIKRLNPGYNFISLPFQQEINSKQICREYPVESVYRQKGFINPQWEEFKCSEAKSFPLKVKRGYLVKANESFDMNFVGDPITDFSYDFVKEGWTSIGVPMATAYNLKASNLCGPLSGTDVQIVEINRWLNGGWDAHICTLPFMNNFSLEDSEGYYVKSVKR